MKTLIQQILTEALEKITYKVEHLDSYQDQNNYELGMYIGEEIIGMVQYTLYGGNITVSDIIVRPEYRRKGFGSRMMQYIKQKHPDFTYKPSMKTQDGSAFKHKEVADVEALEENVGKEVSRTYLSQLLSNTNNNLAKKYLKSWIKRGVEAMITISPREQNILRLIQMGGPKPSDFGTKN